MCKELCGQVYEDYRAGKIEWREFRDYHHDRVLEAMRADSERPGKAVVFLDYRDGTSEIVVTATPVERKPVEDKPAEGNTDA